MSAERRAGREALLWAAIFFSVVSVASGHDAGHGKPVPGFGPHGGALAAVVSAKEAELGEKARTLALAEWKRMGSRIEVYLLDTEKKMLGKKLSGEVKWILLKGEGEKPEVLVTQELRKDFASLDRVRSVEVILPAGLLVAEKSVAAFTLK